jgi:hypothetical protein
MRIATIIVVSALFGVVVGGAVAYVEVSSMKAATTALPHTSQEPSEKQAVARTDEESPRVQIDEPHFDFGSMQRGTSKSHRFIVKNVGTAPLTLRVGQTTCKCTLGEVSDNAIPPGGSTHVLLEWKALTDHGPFTQSATLLTNDPLASSVDLTITGRVTEPTNVSPPEFLFDKISAGEEKSAQVYVMAMLEDDLTISETKLSDAESSDKFEIRVEPVERDELPNPEAKAGARITVTAKPGLPIGRLSQWLSLRTNLADAEELQIPLVGRVIGDISIHGIDWNEEAGVLSLGKVKSSEGRRGRVNIVIRGAGAVNVRLEVASKDPPELNTTIGAPKQITAELVHVPVEIEVPAGTRPMVRLGTAQGEEARVAISTTHPTIKELVLGVRFAVER